MVPQGGRTASRLLGDSSIRTAIGRVASRAEARIDGDLLTATFVDPQLTSELDTPDRQILYGRRGTGKTHVLRVMEKRLADRKSEVAIYSNLVQLGNTKYAMSDQPTERAAGYLRQLLDSVAGAFRDNERYALATASAQVNELQEVLQRQGLALEEQTEEYQEEDAVTQAANAGVKFSPTDMSVNVGLEGKTTQKDSTKVAVVLKPVNAIDFTQVADALRALVKAAKLTRLTLLLDEWAEVPYEVQPHLADYLKRVFFGVNGVTLKIGAIEHRSQMGLRLENNAVCGFEETADVSVVTALDDRAFSYDRDPDALVKRLAALLFRHVTVELAVAAAAGELSLTDRSTAATGRQGLFRRLLGHLPLRRHRHGADVEPDLAQLVSDALARSGWGRTFMEDAGNQFMRRQFGLSSPDEFVEDLFADGAFTQLARGAQGVPRDFMTILRNALSAHGYKDGKLDRTAVRLGVTELYSQKLKDLSKEHQNRLTRLIAFTKAGGGRCFLAEASLSADRTFQDLVDRRLVHRLRAGIPDPKDPAWTYDAYTLDYASYVDAIRSKEIADDDLTTDVTAAVGTVEPFADGRMMRRIVVRLADVK
jgi:hypothetical protein